MDDFLFVSYILDLCSMACAALLSRLVRLPVSPACDGEVAQTPKKTLGKWIVKRMIPGSWLHIAQSIKQRKDHLQTQ